MVRTTEIFVIGAGPVGIVAALYLAKRGFKVTVYEGRPDARNVRPLGGRSINLTLAARGWKALADIGLESEVRKISLPLQGRTIHHEDGSSDSHLYGPNAECLHTVSRTHLTRVLLQGAEVHPNIRLVFGHRLVQLDARTGLLEFDRPEGGPGLNIRATLVLAADGSHSAARASLLRHRADEYRQTYARHWYKELRIPAQDGWSLDPDFTHVWPRGEAMLVAFPNTDRSFGGILFMPFEGKTSFSALRTRADLLALFKSTFPDVLPLAPDLDYAFFSKPIAPLLTTRCAPWTWRGKYALIGDAAHSMVPFLGQGMNAGFEDCTVLDECIERYGADWELLLTKYEELRKPNCDAVTDLAQEHYEQLAVSVKDPSFPKRKLIEDRLYLEHPDRFIPAYTLVSFTRLPYSLAPVLAARQNALVEALAAIEDVEERWESEAVQRVVRDYMTEAPPLMITDDLRLTKTEPPKSLPRIA